MIILILGLLSAASTSSDPTVVVYLASIGAFVVAIATAASYVWSISTKRKQLKLDEDSQEVKTRSVTFDEMEAAIPGLGSLVDRWQHQAETAWIEIERLRASEEVDRAKIAELETQVRALRAELILEKKRNMQLEERILDLEGRRVA